MSTQLALPLGGPAAARPARSPAPESIVPRFRASTYEAGAHTRRTLGWHAPTASPNTATLWNLTTLRDRSRAAVRNDGFARGVLDKLVSNIIGTGIKPLSMAEPPVGDARAFRRDVQALWLRWTDESDADGLLDWYGQQAQAVRCWLEAGECFIRIRPRLPQDGLSVPLQAQVIEPELCPHDWNEIRPNGNRVRAGVEFDRIGRRVAYHFWEQRPGDLEEWDRSRLRRIPAASVVHLFDPLRAGQIRGVPHLTQALIRLYELDKYDDATLLRQQIGNLFAGFLKQGVSDESGLNPLTNLAPNTTHDNRDVVRFEAGVLEELSPGEEVQFSDPPDPPATYPHFIKQQLRSVAAATGVPYEVLTGDMSGLNDRVMRVLLNEFRRRVQAWQHQVVAHQLCRPVWRAWLDRVFLSGALDLPLEFLDDPEPWAAVKWMPQGWPYLHPVQDVQAQSEAIRNGFTSRSAVVSEQGEDAEQIDAEQAADNERADELGLKYESDGRQKKTASAAPPPREPETETPDEGGEAGEGDDPAEQEPEETAA